MPHWIWTALEAWGALCAVACLVVIAVCVAAVVHDRRVYHRWLWKDDD